MPSPGPGKTNLLLTYKQYLNGVLCVENRFVSFLDKLTRPLRPLMARLTVDQHLSNTPRQSTQGAGTCRLQAITAQQTGNSDKLRTPLLPPGWICCMILRRHQEPVSPLNGIEEKPCQISQSFVTCQSPHLKPAAVPQSGSAIQPLPWWRR